KKAPDGPDWLHEMKLDGYRLHARLDAGRGNLLPRRGNHWTEKYPSIGGAIARLPAHSAYPKLIPRFGEGIFLRWQQHLFRAHPLARPLYEIWAMIISSGPQFVL